LDRRSTSRCSLIESSFESNIAGDTPACNPNFLLYFLFLVYVRLNAMLIKLAVSKVVLTLVFSITAYKVLLETS